MRILEDYHEVICELPYGDKMNAVKGRFIHLPLTTEETFNRLKGTQNERLWDVGDLVYVYGKPKKDKSVWRHLIDRHKVYDALKWLVENNSKNCGITKTTIATMPTVHSHNKQKCKQPLHCNTNSL